MLAIKDEQRKWWILAAMGGTLGLVVLDETVLGVALPTIRADFGLSAVGSHWVINAYLLVFTGFAAAAGKLGDLMSIRRLFLAGVSIFGLSSLACGFAENGLWLILARGAQGLGAAIIFPASVAIIAKIFQPEERGLAYGIYTAVGAIFLSLGPMVGGLFTELVSWRWIFWINLPVAVAVFLMMQRMWQTAMDPPLSESAPPLDRLGLFTLVLGLGAVILAIMQGPDWGWVRPLTLGILAVGVFGLGLFVFCERRVATPLIEIDLLRGRTFAAASLVVFTGQFCKFTAVVFGSLWLQHKLAVSPLVAGTVLLCGILPALPMSLVAGRLADKLGERRIVLTALAFNSAAQLGMLLAIYFDHFWLFIPPLMLYGATLPFHYVPTRRAIMRVVRADQQGQAGGLHMTAQLLGGTVAVAVIGALLAETGSYASLFAVTGVLVMVSWLVAWRGLRDGNAGGD